MPFFNISPARLQQSSSLYTSIISNLHVFHFVNSHTGSTSKLASSPLLLKLLSRNIRFLQRSTTPSMLCYLLQWKIMSPIIKHCIINLTTDQFALLSPLCDWLFLHWSVTHSSAIRSLMQQLISAVRLVVYIMHTVYPSCMLTLTVWCDRKLHPPPFSLCDRVDSQHTWARSTTACLVAYIRARCKKRFRLSSFFCRNKVCLEEATALGFCCSENSPQHFYLAFYI